jgi:MFS family permease
VSETAKPHRRGPLVATQLSIVVFGLFFAYWLDYGCIKHLSGDATWRIPIAIQCVFALITLFTIPFLPESPRWLYAKGLIDDGNLVIARLRDIAIDHPIVSSTRAAILEVSHLEDSGESKGLNWRHIFYDPTEIKPTRRIMLGVMLQFLQVFSGISLAVYYLNILFQVNLGFDYEKGALLSGFNTFTLWLGTLPPIWLVEKYGRRQVLMFGSITMAASMITFTVCVAVNNTTSSYIGVAAIYAYMFFFGLSWQPVPWIYPPEIAPLNLRHIGGAASTGSEWIFAFVAGKLTYPSPFVQSQEAQRH